MTKLRSIELFLAHRWVRTARSASLAALLLAPAGFLACPASAAPAASIQPSPGGIAIAAFHASISPQILADDPPSIENENAGDGDTSSPEDPVQDGRADSRATPSSRGGTRVETPAQPRGERIVDIAKQLVGSPYRWSGASPSGFDCSGFTSYVYGQAGIGIPRDLGGQLNAGPSISVDDLQPGDLLIFKNTYAQGLSHAGVYIGNGQFIDAQDEADGVVVNLLDQWASHFAGASRPWGR